MKVRIKSPLIGKSLFVLGLFFYFLTVSFVLLSDPYIYKLGQIGFLSVIVYLSGFSVSGFLLFISLYLMGRRKGSYLILSLVLLFLATLPLFFKTYGYGGPE